VIRIDGSQRDEDDPLQTFRSDFDGVRFFARAI
jgi:hypothetical protein